MPLREGVRSAHLNSIDITKEAIQCNDLQEFREVTTILHNAGFCWRSGSPYNEFVPEAVRSGNFPIYLDVDKGAYNLILDNVGLDIIKASDFINSNTVTVSMSHTSHITTERRVITIKPREHAVTVEDIAPSNMGKGALLTFKDSPYEELYMSFNVHATSKHLLHCFALKSHTVQIGEVVVLDYKKLQVIDDMELSLKLKQL